MKLLILILLIGLLVACSAPQTTPLQRAKNVDLKRFMGDWYVLANIPTFLEKEAYNARESYSMNDDGTIATTFSFNKNNFHGKRVFYYPTGFVNPQDNSLWDMQFIWPFKAEYIIAYVSADYQQTIIARSNRDYLWIMARTPQISSKDYQQLLRRCVEMGYDKVQIHKVPQQWQQINVFPGKKNELPLSFRSRRILL